MNKKLKILFRILIEIEMKNENALNFLKAHLKVVHRC